MNFQDIMKQAQKMQEDMGRIEEEINNTVYTGTAGGAIKVEIDGSYNVNTIDISADIIGDKEALEELLVIAVNDSLNQIKTDREERMGVLTQGMDLPGGF